MAALTGQVDLESGLTAEEKSRSLLCAAEIEAVCLRYGCMIVAAPIIAGDGLYAEYHVVPKQPRRK